jgi:hypothetical protein
MNSDRKEPSGKLSDDLEPNILPRQRRALERVAARLTAKRPAPSPGFRASLDGRVRELVGHARGPTASGWRLSTALLLGLGFASLVVVAILVAAGEPGGH